MDSINQATHRMEVTRIFHDYHKQLTGRDYIDYDEHGNVYGFITQYRPFYQAEILDVMYEAGYKAGILASS